jgi:hypothetical protein
MQAGQDLASLSVLKRRADALRKILSCDQAFVLAGHIPQGQLNAVPQSKLVVDQAQVVLHHVLGGAKIVRDFLVLAALGYAPDDEVFALAWCPLIC